MTSSYDGCVCLPFRYNVPIKVTDNAVLSITELSDNTVACSCDDDELNIISLPLQDDTLFSMLDSIRKSTT